MLVQHTQRLLLWFETMVILEGEAKKGKQRNVKLKVTFVRVIVINGLRGLA